MARARKYDITHTSSRRKRGRRGVAVVLLDVILLVLTIFFGLLLLCAYLARYVPPQTTIFFSFMGLIAPILYITNALFALYWVVRWRWFFAIPLTIIVIGWGGISLLFRPAFSKDYSEPPSSSVAVMSYNVMGLIYKNDSGKFVSSVDSISGFMNSQNPAILCMQEFQSRSEEHKKEIDSLLGMRYNVVNYKKANSSGGGWGLAVYSDYPIINSGHIDFVNSNNSSQWVDIVVKSDTVRVFNNHLQTTSVDDLEKKYLSNHEFIYDSDEREERVRGILSKLKRGFILRASQVDSLSKVISASPYRSIVCGDFNDTPLSYAYHKMRGNLLDSFVERGSGLSANTYKGLFNLFRIDYILHSPQIKTHLYSTPYSQYSDHKSIVVRLGL